MLRRYSAGSLGVAERDTQAANLSSSRLGGDQLSRRDDQPGPLLWLADRVPDDWEWVRGGYVPPPRSTHVAPAVIAVVLLVTTVVVGGLGSTTLAVLTGLGTVVSLGLVVRRS